MSDYIQDAIGAGALRIEAEPLGKQRYQVTITSAERVSPWGTWREPITMQPDYPDPPTLGQVLYYTATRLQAVEDTDDFLDWCTETGCDASDAEAYRRYGDLIALRDRVRGTMGVEAYDGLLAGLAIEQAIERAAQAIRPMRTGN
ncbi:MAG: hypothetical protein AAGG50_10400 [Bacteroidota bacterium]